MPGNYTNLISNVFLGPMALGFYNVEALPQCSFNTFIPSSYGWHDRLQPTSRIGCYGVNGDDTVVTDLGTASLLFRKQDTLPHALNEADRNYHCLMNGLTGITAKAWLAEMLEDEYGMIRALPGERYDILTLLIV